MVLCGGAGVQEAVAWGDKGRCWVPRRRLAQRGVMWFCAGAREVVQSTEGVCEELYAGVWEVACQGK